METSVYNLKNEKVGTVTVSDVVFGAKWNSVLVKQVLDAQMANARIPWAHTKDRGEVRGGGRKPWRQKGTGRARHGSIRSPIWVGGGKSHGPRNERDYSQKVNKKMKRLAVFSVLSRKMKEGEIKIFEDLSIEQPKTKFLAPILKNIIGMKKYAKRFDVILVANDNNVNLSRASRNLTKVAFSKADSLNVYDIMNYKNIFMDKDSALNIDKYFKVKNIKENKE
jgi:large subunit ribosomal protein L4